MLFEMKLFIALLLTSVFLVKGQDVGSVKVLQKSHASFGKCLKPFVDVVFEEVKSSSGKVYRRSLQSQDEIDCLMPLQDLDKKAHNFKSCMEGADKAGYNVFILDGDTCKVSNAKLRKNGETSDDMIALYTADHSGATVDNSLHFTLSNVTETSLVINVEDTSNCAGRAEYKATIGDQDYDVGVDGLIENVKFVFDCPRAEVMLTRLLNGLHYGISSVVDHIFAFEIFRFTFTVYNVTNTSFTISTDDPCSSKADYYKISFNDQEYRLGDDGSVTDAVVPPCVVQEFVLTRYVGDVASGTANASSPTYEEFIDNFNSTIVFFESGMFSVTFLWYYDNCLDMGYVQSFAIFSDIDPVPKVMEPIDRGSQTLYQIDAIDDCADMIVTYFIQVEFQDGVPPIEPIRVPLLEKGLTDIMTDPYRVFFEEAGTGLKLIISGDSCKGSVDFYLAAQTDDPLEFFKLDENFSTPNLTLPVDGTHKYVLEHRKDGYRVGRPYVAEYIGDP